jgi:hypothetical protein
MLKRREGPKKVKDPEQVLLQLWRGQDPPDPDSVSALDAEDEIHVHAEEGDSNHISVYPQDIEYSIIAEVHSMASCCGVGELINHEEMLSQTPEAGWAALHQLYVRAWRQVGYGAMIATCNNEQVKQIKFFRRMGWQEMLTSNSGKTREQSLRLSPSPSQEEEEH